MAENTSIEWAHHTFNPWQGCTKVSPGCKHCYAEALDRRHLRNSEDHWGPAAPRIFASESYMRQPHAWNRKAKRAGERARVFCMSMGDLFEQHQVPLYAAIQARYRRRLYELIEQTPWLDWLLLSKRPENMTPMLPVAWRAAPPANVWLGTSIENQATAEERLPVLLDTPARVHFVSYEPALGPVDLEKAASAPEYAVPLQLDWVIAGDESGPGARPARRWWMASMRDQCQRLGVKFFFKQWDQGKVSLPLLGGRQWCQVPTSRGNHV